METKESQESLQPRLSFFHRGRLFSSDRDDSSDSDDYLETGLNFVSDERFRKPVAIIELEEFGRSWASDSSRRKWCWVPRVFEDWRKARNKLVL